MTLKRYYVLINYIDYNYKQVKLDLMWLNFFITSLPNFKFNEINFFLSNVIA